MVQAHDIESAKQAKLLRTNLVTGLQSVYTSAFGVELLRVLEEGQQMQLALQTYENSSKSYCLVYDQWPPSYCPRGLAVIQTLKAGICIRYMRIMQRLCQMQGMVHHRLHPPTTTSSHGSRRIPASAIIAGK
jgi:hypothetical protein